MFKIGLLLSVLTFALGISSSAQAYCLCSDSGVVVVPAFGSPSSFPDNLSWTIVDPFVAAPIDNGIGGPTNGIGVTGNTGVPDGGPTSYTVTAPFAIPSDGGTFSLFSYLNLYVYGVTEGDIITASLNTSITGILGPIGLNALVDVNDTIAAGLVNVWLSGSVASASFSLSAGSYTLQQDFSINVTDAYHDNIPYSFDLPGNSNLNPVSVVEPSSLLLLSIGLMAAGFGRRGQANRQAGIA